MFNYQLNLFFMKQTSFLIAGIVLAIFSCKKVEETPDCPSSIYEDKTSSTHVATANTINYGSDSKGHSGLNLVSVDSVDMYLAKVENDDYELWLRFDKEVKKGCRNSAIAGRTEFAEYPAPNQSIVGITMIDYVNYSSPETLYVSSSALRYGEVHYNYNEIFLMMDSVVMTPNSAASPNQELSLYLYLNYP